MEMEISLIDSITRVKLLGRLDTHGVDQIETKFTACVVSSHRDAVVDLTNVTFVSSGGLRMFIVTAKALKRHDARLILFGAQPQVSEVFASASLGSIVQIALCEADALGLMSAE